MVKVKACFQRLYFREAFSETFRRRLMNISEDASRPTTFVTVCFIVGSFKPALPNFALTAKGMCNLDDGAR